MVQFFCIFIVFQATQFVLVLSQQSCQTPIVFQSCEDIKKHSPYSPSGYYRLGRAIGGYATTYLSYCHMGELCNSKGGWSRIAYLDMTDINQYCPYGFKQYQSGGVRACGRQTTQNPSCQSIRFPTNGISYSQICGRVTGYQYHSTNAAQNYDWISGRHDINHTDINSYYVDGISITRGSPRQHVWTFMAGISDTDIHDQYNCPCSIGSNQSHTLQSFIGNDYFCESGNPNKYWEDKLYTEDPLWDGKGCGTNEATCCSAAGLPWFNKVLNSTTTDYIELRVCADQGTDNEEAPVSFYEIYIK